MNRPTKKSPKRNAGVCSPTLWLKPLKNSKKRSGCPPARWSPPSASTTSMQQMESTRTSTNLHDGCVHSNPLLPQSMSDAGWRLPSLVHRTGVAPRCLPPADSGPLSMAEFSIWTGKLSLDCSPRAEQRPAYILGDTSAEPRWETAPSSAAKPVFPRPGDRESTPLDLGPAGNANPKNKAHKRTCGSTLNQRRAARVHAGKSQSTVGAHCTPLMCPPPSTKSVFPVT